MGLVDDVSANVPNSCLVSRARAQGCSVSLPGTPASRLLIDMDCRELGLDQRASRCDYLFVGDDGDWVVPMELKRGNIRASEVSRQLQAGARFAERVIPRRANVNFLSVVAHGGKVDRTERRALESTQFRFRGKSVGVELIRCGQPLSDALHVNRPSRRSRRRAR